ncbi:MAG TPA: hypothetical protein VKF15_05245 [Nitrososphaerales archaeon]|nr:hypothetical protein [Nitrososphaerales archaeon]
MDVKPSKGLKVRVNAHREAVFGEESVAVSKVSMPDDGSRMGVLTGTTLAGFCEVQMPALDGNKHWYPLEELTGEHGEAIVEDEVPIEEEADGEEDGSEE